MAAKYKVTYFPIMGLGEPIRFLLAYMGEDFEDCRVKWGEWPDIKPNTPWGKMPILEIEGKAGVTQSQAVTRFLARQAGLCGDGAWEDLKIDEIVSVVDELRGELAKYYYERDEERKASLKEPVLTQTVPFYMKKINTLIQENKGYLANGKFSWADVFFAAISDHMSNMNGSDITADYPQAKALRERVYAIPKIKAWVDKRPKDVPMF
uniref:glutathione transferase n=1 Tax=Matsumurasca onukii TaxID=2912585 RepID=A0A5B8YUN1_MATON|nr:glutathione S-transferase [Matsumurasca onukii]